MPHCTSVITRTAGLFIVRYGADAPQAAQRKYEELTAAGYATSADTARKVLAEIEQIAGASAAAHQDGRGA
jgi:hypothetical protein